MHETQLIATIAIAFSLALLGGFAAARIGLPPIVGYLVAGIAIGPFTPGFIADQGLAQQLAEIGVILLMFGVGIHFSLRDLLSVRSIAIPGAIFQSAVATAIATFGAVALGWSVGAGIVLGLAISVASTVVLLRALGERGSLDTTHGRVAVGWLIIEDIFTVVVLVLLPPLAGLLQGDAAGDLGGLAITVAVTLAKVAALGVLMFVVGIRVLPWFLNQVARTGSRELFTLSVLALALGVAFGSSVVFGVSFALGAFLAGVVVSESDLSHQAATDALPLRDAFAVLFFVSVGMLLEPSFILSAPLAVLAVLALVVIGKGLAALTIVLLRGYPIRTGLTVAFGLAQVGEFSFILSNLGLELGLLPQAGHSLVLAAALLSITLNPFLFRMIEPIEIWLRRRERFHALLDRRGGSLSHIERTAETLRGHAVLCGYGRVGRQIAAVLRKRGFSFIVIDQNREAVESLRAEGVTALYGDAANRTLLEHAGWERARVLVVAISDTIVTRQVIDVVRRHNPSLHVVARTHNEDMWRELRDVARVDAVLGEQELAVEMASHALRRFGVSSMEIVSITQGMRHN